EAERHEMLLAMATGTGKTKLAVALLYRLLAANRFRRSCFVVDRKALGRQAEAEFRSTKVVSVKTFADIFGLKGLTDIAPESRNQGTHLHFSGACEARRGRQCRSTAGRSIRPHGCR